jgi:HrpA-like RNA helicase
MFPIPKANITSNQETLEKSTDNQLNSPTTRDEPPTLEINNRKTEIMDAINSNPVTIIRAPTGTGKVKC